MGEWRGFLEEADKDYIETLGLHSLMYSGRGSLGCLSSKFRNCGGTGIDTTIPTNTVQVPIATGTVMDSGSVYTGLLGVISGYIYSGQVNCERWPVDRPSGWIAGLTNPGTHVWGGEVRCRLRAQSLAFSRMRIG